MLVWGWMLSSGNNPFSVVAGPLARRLGIKNAIAVSTTVNVLMNHGLLTRESTGLQTEYRIVPGKGDLDVIRIFDARREKRYQDRRRLRQMLDFVYAETCRHQFILDYFGDQSDDRTCGGCDNCSGRLRASA